jgi:hypothetical protein|tara:strand:- start:924 stop:1181 length:258 start_codon:yes stop_codon:yes gene_type:complete
MEKRCENCEENEDIIKRLREFIDQIEKENAVFKDSKRVYNNFFNNVRNLTKYQGRMKGGMDVTDEISLLVDQVEEQTGQTKKKPF